MEVNAYVQVIGGMVNLFLESSGDLCVLETKDIADPAQVKQSEK